MDKKNRRASIFRELALFLLLLWAFAQVVIIAFIPTSQQVEYFVMIFAMDVAMIIGFMSSTSLCTVICGTLSCIWVSYKLYCFYALGTIIYAADFVMIVMPLLGMLSAVLFEKGLSGLSNENVLLRKQVEELVLINEMTGLYNLRAMYKDLLTMVSYTKRNKAPISLMILQMRYQQELSSMLSRSQYIKLCQSFALFVSNHVRVEDRTYAIDDKGTLAVIVTASNEDSSFVRNRFLHEITQTDVFDGILEHGTTLQLRIACKQYQEEYGNDMIRFKQDVQSELVYDV